MAASHELGHALGLAHSNSNNIMYEHATSRTTLGVDDIDSYNYLY
ncbi:MULTISPECIES: matrixin family metalloprotease [unclassified Methanosarcina]